MNLFKKLFGYSKPNPKSEIDKLSDDLDSIDAKLEILEKMISNKNALIEENKEHQSKIDALKKQNVEISDWLKNYLESIRANNLNVPSSVIKNVYFENMNKQKEAERKHDYKSAYAHAQSSISLLEGFIKNVYEEDGTFYVKGFPSVQFSLKYTSIMGLVGGFKNISEIINYFPEVRVAHKEDLKEYEILLELSKKIRKLVKTNSEILQRALKKELPDYEPRLISDSCYWMEKFGLLKREKISNTYKLSLTY